MMEGDNTDWLYHYELALARLLTTVVKDEDGAYLVASTTPRHKEHPVLDCEAYDRVEAWGNLLSKKLLSTESDGKWWLLKDGQVLQLFLVYVNI